jgi:hypothetical protein
MTKKKSPEVGPKLVSFRLAREHWETLIERIKARKTVSGQPLTIQRYLEELVASDLDLEIEEGPE